MITQDDIDAMCGDELLPCPFCGGDGVHFDTFKGYKVECENRNSNKCPVNMRSRYQANYMDAANLWNTRANLQRTTDKL